MEATATLQIGKMPDGSPAGSTDGSTGGSAARALVQSVEALLAGLDVADLTPLDRADCLRSFTVVDGMVAAARSRVLAGASAGGSRRSRERSAELVRETGMSGMDASRAVRLADTLTAVPAAADALAEGRITTGHASVLAGGVSWLNRGAAAHDGSLIDAACNQCVDEFKATVAQWELVENGDADGRRLAARQHKNRTAHWFTRDDGMIRLQADFAPDTGAMVTRAVHTFAEMLWRTEDGRTAHPAGDSTGNLHGSLSGPDTPEMRRTIGQRNADAIAELIRRGGDPNTPRETGESRESRESRPQVDLLVSVDLARLQLAENSTSDPSGDRRDPYSRCETSDGLPLSPAAVRRLACDAGIIPVALGAKGAVLDIGRHTRNIPPAIRKALMVRDGGCTFPGCNQPDSWCDAHHVKHWADGGPTSLDNLVLLCSTHHHCVHDGSWTIERAADMANPRESDSTDGPATGRWVLRSSIGQEYPIGGNRDGPSP